jgi:patatin-like phospholipase/acyl hydrolase
LFGTGVALAVIATVCGFALVGDKTPGPIVPGAAAKDPPPIKRQKYIILACDGGGVRGALTARLVKEIEDELKKKPNPADFSFCNRVNCFAGTSTGGLIALGLASGRTPDEVLATYGDEKKWGRIFTRYKPLDEMPVAQRAGYGLARSGLELAEGKLKKVIDPGWAEGIDGLFFARFDSAGVKEVVKEAVGEQRTLGDLAPKRSVVVTTLWLGDKKGMKVDAWRPMILHNLQTVNQDGKRGSEDIKKEDQFAQDAKTARKMTILDAALCTCAAPTYFPPHRVEGVGCFADGGVFANNPGIAALSMAIRAGVNIDDIHILSVGTGSVANYMKVPPWDAVDPKLDGKYCGTMAWLSPKSHHGVPEAPLIAAMFDAGAAADELYCKAILGDRYRRIQVPLEKDIDLADKAEVPRLIQMAADYITTPAWNEHKVWLRKIASP